MRTLKVLVLLGLLTLTRIGFAFPQANDVSLPDNAEGDSGSTVTIPIVVGDLTGRNVISYQAVITFDESVLDATAASSAGTLSESFGPPTVNTSVDGQIGLGGFGTASLSGSGSLVNLEFYVVGSLLDVTDLLFASFVFNAGDPPATTDDGRFTVTGVVPVELSSFSAEVTRHSVKLTWTTASETNNYGFEIGKSLDGEMFSKIGFVAGKGTTSIPQEYIFYDRDIRSGILYYRLKQIDTNGSFEFSDILKVEAPSPEDFMLAQNYPNPFNANTFIDFHISSPSRVILKIFNLNGEEIKTLFEQPHFIGFHRIKWDGLNNEDKMVTSGIYIYELRAGGIEKSNKMILLR